MSALVDAVTSTANNSATIGAGGWLHAMRFLTGAIYVHAGHAVPEALRALLYVSMENALSYIDRELRAAEQGQPTTGAWQKRHYPAAGTMLHLHADEAFAAVERNKAVGMPLGATTTDFRFLPAPCAR
jgi:hypothetical protein